MLVGRPTPEVTGSRRAGPRVETLTPRLHLRHAESSTLAPQRFCDEVKAALKGGPSAWDPYER